MALDPERRAQTLALLEANHQFPGPFYLSVVSFNRDEVVANVRAAVATKVTERLTPDRWETHPSQGGKYISQRVTLTCESAEAVLAIYERVWAVEGVVTIL
jgi:putative lipoic acid-binding regulatory protein